MWGRGGTTSLSQREGCGGILTGQTPHSRPSCGKLHRIPAGRGKKREKEDQCKTQPKSEKMENSNCS